MAVISISLPETLLDRADGFIAERGYAGRSELLRTALRAYLNEQADPVHEGTTTATCTLIYPHGVERKVSSVRHDHNEIVRSMMHGHSENACVEVFILKGPAHRVRGFVDGLRAIREAYRVEATYADLATPGAPHEHA